MKYKTNDKDNEYELLYLVSEGNEDAKDLFYKKYLPIVELKANKYKAYAEQNGYDYNDIVQEGMIGLSEALASFKDTENTQFSTFANLCIERHISSYVRNMNRDKHKILNTSLSLDSDNLLGRPLTEIIFDNNSLSPEMNFEKNENERELYSKIKDCLTNQELKVLNLRLEGYSYKEISNKLNITEKSVGGCLERIRNKTTNILKEINNK